jgi:hypothetical protein
MQVMMRKTKRPRRHSSKHGERGVSTGKPPSVQWKKSIRLICKDLVGQHSTEIAYQLRDGMLNKNLRLALKYLGLVASYESGKPVETHRMVGLQDGPTGAYDLTKLDVKQQKSLLKLLRSAKDQTKPSGSA